MHDLVAEFIQELAGDASWKYPLLFALIERQKIGLETYNTPLQPFNGRDALKDAFEEFLDGACYLRQAVYESDHGEKRMPELETLFGQTVELCARVALAMRHRQLPDAVPEAVDSPKPEPGQYSVVIKADRYAELLGKEKATDRLRGERDKLRAFARDLLMTPDLEIDEAVANHLGEEYGLLKTEMMAGPCGEQCACAEFAEFPTECLRYTPLLEGSADQNTPRHMDADPASSD